MYHYGMYICNHIKRIFFTYRARYHKYKGRYADVIKAYTDLQNENAKVKNVMQQTQVQFFSRLKCRIHFGNNVKNIDEVLARFMQVYLSFNAYPFSILFQDKALRRISELREQCQLEQNAKRHLEEELRSDMEEKEHIIKALQVNLFAIYENKATVCFRDLGKLNLPTVVRF
jgi:hypothetical protein